MRPNPLAILFATGAAPFVAYSQIYFTETEVLKSLLPNQSLKRNVYPLTDLEITQIEKTSGENVRNKSIIAWVAADKSTVFIDQVLGKHEFITYAVAIGSDSKVKGIEIMEYRETYGQQVQGKEWRSQFIGKANSDSLKLNQDIVNISGATLSSAHVTGGVRRMLQTYVQLRNRL